ncbi:asparagine synthase (glutamine-hydrolyzing) [Noviherbaspirillum sp. 1P10PC]|uniref:asparagine synthase (glutamine-hydrolyzing) n=1 Tax=Noviherbaspirillum sp. 1P10PC TaxID=3132292 RepID=UPI0039A21F22
MCGISGFLSSDNSHDFDSSVHDMAQALLHRGPDGGGVWSDAARGVALGHRRLAIVDLSPAGRQPMHSACGRYVMAFNGEIYNHQELRRQLNESWRGHSDTETLLAAFSHWGIEATLQRTVGMFAIALWDRMERRLYLMRDRMGEKPLYYGWGRNVFFFGSELKALRQHPGFSNEIDRDALCLYFRQNYIPAPRSIYRNICKLEPGCMLSLTLADATTAPPSPLSAPAAFRGLKLHRWWSLHDVAQAGQRNPIRDEVEALERLESLLHKSIAMQSVADVPLGAFLSGGVDSSLIVALMQANSAKPVHTYTIGFNEAAYDEAGYARAIASHLGTRHTELYISALDGLDVIPRLPALFDEPFSDVSQIPTYLVAQQARQHVTVALSGDAGDELFAGYNRHLRTQHVWNLVAKVPAGCRQLFSRCLKRSSASPAARALGQGMSHLIPMNWHAALYADKLLKLADRIDGARDCDDLYFNLVSEWKHPDALVLGGHEPLTLLRQRDAWPQLATFEDRMMYLDSMTYLPDDILVKVDRAAMATSLETRVPFLDHRIVELAWRMPVGMKIDRGQGKQALRKILDKHVPRHLIERPKQGFSVPVGSWLKGPLREWAEHLLNRGRLQQEGYLNANEIESRWQEHLSGRRNWEHSLWSVLMFQSWLEHQAVPQPVLAWQASG